MTEKDREWRSPGTTTYSSHSPSKRKMSKYKKLHTKPIRANPRIVIRQALNSQYKNKQEQKEHNPHTFKYLSYLSKAEMHIKRRPPAVLSNPFPLLIEIVAL